MSDRIYCLCQFVPAIYLHMDQYIICGFGDVHIVIVGRAIGGLVFYSLCRAPAREKFSG
jgi:hypothetical protein